jgi:hypothetical protein
VLGDNAILVKTREIDIHKKGGHIEIDPAGELGLRITPVYRDAVV